MSTNGAISWTVAEDMALLQGVQHFQQIHLVPPFPAFPYEGSPIKQGTTTRLLRIIYQIKPDFSRSGKQIRSRWDTHFNPNLRSIGGILEKDHYQVARMIHQYARVHHTMSGTEVSRVLYQSMGDGTYYSENQLKNFYHSKYFRKIEHDLELEQTDKTKKKMRSCLANIENCLPDDSFNVLLISNIQDDWSDKRKI